MAKFARAAITIAFTVIGSAIGGPIGASIGTFVGTTLGNVILPPSTGKPRAAAASSLQIGEVPRQAIIGRAATPGSLVDAFNYGGKYGTDWEVLVIALADHRCDALEGVYVNDNYVPFSSDGAVAGYNDQLNIWWRPGTETQSVPSVLLANQPGCTENDNGAGVSYAVVAYKADASDAKNPVWTNGRPRFQFVVRGALCYDPRLDSTVGGSGTQRWANPSTWTWSENPIVTRYKFARGFFACDRVTQPEQLLVGRGLSAVEAPEANLFHRANLCDEVVDGAPRYRVGGLIEATETYIDVENDFAAACAGTIVQPEGSVEIDPGEAKAPVVTITDADLVVGSKVKRRWFLGIADRAWVNSVVASYIEPGQNWSAHTAPVRRDIADIQADGAPREEAIQLGFVTWAKQAGRVAEIVRRMGRLFLRAELVLPPRFCELEEGDWIVWQSDRYLNGQAYTFRIEAWGSDKAWQHSVVLRQISASCYSDTAPLADGSVAVQQAARPAIGAPATANWSVTAGHLAAGGIRTPAVIVSGASDDPSARFVRLEYVQSVAAPTAETIWSDAGVTGPDVKRREISVAAGGSYWVAISYIVDGVQGDRLVKGPVTALTVAYPDGTAVESLKPGEAGAQRATWDNVKASDPAAPADYATADISLIHSGTIVAVSGNSVSLKPGGQDSNRRTYSKESYARGAFCSFTLDGVQDGEAVTTLVGFTTDITQGQGVGYDEGGYGFFVSLTPHNFDYGEPGLQSAEITIYENGAYAASITHNYHNSDYSNPIFSLGYDDEYVRYFLDGKEAYSSYAGSGRRFHFDSLLYDGSINNIRFGPYAAANSPITFTSSHIGGSAETAQSVNGNTVFKRRLIYDYGYIYTWNTKSISSQTSVGTAFVSFKLAGPESFSGLHEVGNTLPSFDSLRSSFYRDAAGRRYCWSFTGALLDMGIVYNDVTFTDDSDFKITYDGLNTSWYVDNVLMFTQTSPANLVFQAGVALYNFNSLVSDIQFGPFTDRAWSNIGVGDPSRPADGATRNVNRGAWSSASVAYALGDFVQRDGSSYSVGTAHISTAGNGPPGAHWTLLAAQGPAGANGLNGTNGTPGANGSNGQTSYVHFAFADNATGTANFTTGDAGGRYYIGTYTDFTVADSTNPASYTWSLFRGADGANGTPGAPGADGASTYVHIAYATNSNGTSGFSTTDGAGKTYIGTYTDGTLADSTNPALYTWSLIKGADGAAGTPGTNGTNGAPGAAGTPAITGYLTNEAVQIFAYANGGVISYAPATGSFKIFSGNTDVSASFSLSTVSNPQALTISYTGRTYTVTAGLDASEDTATLTIRATGSGAYAGVTLDKVFSIAKAKGGYEIVSALPTTNLFAGRVVYLDTNGKLYRYVTTPSAAWTAEVDGADIKVGSVVTDNLASGAITAAKLATTALFTNKAQINDLYIGTQKIEDLAITSSASYFNDFNGSFRQTGYDFWYDIGTSGSYAYVFVGNGNGDYYYDAEFGSYQYVGYPDGDYIYQYLLPSSAQVSVTTSPTAAAGSQKVYVEAMMVLSRDGGDDDNIDIQIIRNGTTALPEVYTNIQVFSGRRPYTFFFVDQSPAPNVINTYKLQLRNTPNDGAPYLYDVSLRATLYRK